ncbi:dentin sialophosphoprotein isoform X2 [Hyalella azteca]|uniref:Dentin sialophosphoprotein isoform X2 n=1 Tax=Hyalella azteca TaxID=294128 RepID=A0A979FRX1_HYAAZ|nr:dentin sialophosphoprotein isoform X2 [Hyalella azteca]
MREVESLPTYGIHYYDVKDRNDLPWYIGLSNRGISQYDYLDKRKPRRVFLWRQLENIYFRERKFSIEVLDPKRVCVSRRSLGSASASVTVHVWFAESQAQCKAIWSMAIAQHQFYLDTKALRSEEQSAVCDMPELAVDLSRSCLSLSTHSSSSNLSRSGSHSSLQQHSQAESGSSESLEAARLEMLEALRLRRSGLQEKLSAKTEELRLLCLREGELTGELPPEYPLVPGQPPPSVRKRVGTSFALDESIIDKIINKQEETVSALELECEIMAKITSAALRLANESTARKGVRRQRKLSYQQSAHRLRELEQKLKQARSKAVVTASTLPKQKKKPRPLSDCEGIEDSGITGSLSSSAGSGRESPRDLTGFQSTLPSPSLNNTLTLHDANGSRLRDRNSTFTSHDTSDSSRQSDRNSTITPRDTSDGSRQNGRNNHHDNTDSGRQRDRSPHRTRGSAPASPYRSAASTCSSNSGGGGDAGGGGGGGSLGDGSGSVHNSTMTSSSSSRPTSPSCPSRPLSSDRRRGNSASRAEVFRTTPDTPDHAAACQLLDGALFNYHPHYQSGTPRVPEHFDPHQLVQQGPNVNFHYNHQARRHTSGSKLRHSNSSAMHNTSGSSLSSSQPHNTTSSSISSSTSGNHCTPPNRQSLYSPYVGGNPHNGYSMGPVQHHTPQNNGMYFQDHHGAYYSPSSHGIHNDHRQTNAGYVREMQRRTSQEPSYYNPHQTINSSYPTPPPHQSYSTSQTQREVLAKVSPENVSSPSRSRHGQSKELTASDSGCGADSSCDTRQSNADVSDGHPNATHPAPVSQNYSNSSFPHSDEHSYQSCSKSDDLNPEPIHTLVRTSSGRSYMETTFLGDCSSASSTTSNQENIPPVKRVVPSEQLLPLKPTGVHLRASASVTPADLAPPRLLPAADLIPLRATKSSSELPPLKATNPRGEYHGSNSNAEPLMSLAEAANLKKDREREWYETSLDSPGSGRKPQKCAAAEIVISKFPGIASASATAVSSNNDVSSSALSPELPSNSPNERDQSVIISTGSYQPSREVSKPFEMADFYKYSTKYRKQMHGSGMNSSNSSFSNGSDSNHMSPVLPPRAQVVVSSSKAAPPSPNVIAKQSTPAAQQKGIYQSLAPYTCQGVGSHPSPGAPNTPSWEGTPLHQAVPATVTNKRSATLV